MIRLPVLLEPAAMHIPDGFLSVTIAILCWVITAIILLLAIARTRGEFSERQIPLMGVIAAFIFAAQMINFPVAGGTSGHLLGGALAAIILGPWAGILVMASVIIVQGLLFQDGGLLVMGANILNMGLVTALIGYGLYRSVASRSLRLRLSVAGIAAWLSVMAGALVTSLQLWLSGTVSLKIVLPAMLGVHALIGIGEALITVAALAFILRTRPDLLEPGEGQARAGRSWVVAGIILVVFVLMLSPIASINPDGLERVAIDLGFIQHSQTASSGLLRDYTIPFLGKTSLSTILAGLLGALVVVVVIILVVRLVGRRRSQLPKSPK